MTGASAVAEAAAVVAPPPGGPATGETATDETATATAARLERAAAMLLKRLRPTRPGELTRSQASLLATVAELGPLSLAAIARHEAVQAPTASRAVDLLVQRRLLRREVDPVDHRRHLIDLDTDAVDLLEARSRRAVEVLAGALASLGPDDRAAIDGALPALADLVDRLGR